MCELSTSRQVLAVSGGTLCARELLPQHTPTGGGERRRDDGRTGKRDCEGEWETQTTEKQQFQTCDTTRWETDERC